MNLSATLEPSGKVRIQASGLQPGEAIRLKYFQEGEEGEIRDSMFPGSVETDGTFSWLSSLNPGTWLIQLHSQDGVACSTIAVK